MLPEEFEAAVVRYYDTLLRLAVQRAGSRAEAEDIVQDTFLQLLRSIIRHTRKPAAMIAAAVAAMLCIGTVTVGAAAGWNYSALFDRYFSHKSETAVSYDFTGMGGDLNEVFETEDFIVTLDGYIADTYSVYFYYDTQLKHAETVGETEQRGDRWFNATHPVMRYCVPNSFERLFDSASGSVLGRDADGTVHYVERVMVPAGESLEGKSIDISCEAVGSGFDGYNGNYEDIHTVTLDTVYPTEMQLLDTPVMLSVPDTGEDTALNRAAVSPIGVYLTTDTAQQAPAMLSAGGAFSAALMEFDAVTVHHTDGTEEQKEVTKAVSMEANDTGLLNENVTLLSFKQPLPLDDVDYVAVSGTVIPVR
ncbi:MAG: hypothetical protein IKH27_08475 [Oscillospiraceae bacterium]|nr:hypothetical protein [Oscillospiraceae bacterium]